MFSPFHIFKVQSDGSLRWVEAAAGGNGGGGNGFPLL